MKLFKPKTIFNIFIIEALAFSVLYVIAKLSVSAARADVHGFSLICKICYYFDLFCFCSAPHISQCCLSTHPPLM